MMNKIHKIDYLRELGCCPRCVLVHCGVRDAVHFASPAAVAAATSTLAVPEVIHQNNGDSSLSTNNGPSADAIIADMQESSLSSNGDTRWNASDLTAVDDVNGSTGTSDASSEEEKVCVCCLGLLQSTCCSRDLIEKICEPTIRCGYDADSFSLSITLPLSITARAHIIALLYSQHCSTQMTKEHRDGLTVNMKDAWKAAVGGLAEAVLGKTFCSGEAVLGVSVMANYPQDAAECHTFMTAAGYTGQAVKRQKDHKRKQFRYKQDDRKPQSSDSSSATSVVDVSKSLPCDDAQCDAVVPEYSRQAIAGLLASVAPEVLLQRCPLPPAPKAALVLTPIQPVRSSVFVAGRYRKYSRELSQTPWVINGELKCEASVEQLMAAHILPAFGTQELKFLSSGREDVDVRCLGRGRPFALELLQPRTASLDQASLLRLQRRINQSTADISVSHLQIMDKEGSNVLRFNTEDKIKSYSALCLLRDGQAVTEEMLERLRGLAPLTIQQQTPLRVLHRRPLLTRPRIVHTMTAERVRDNFFTVDMRTDAGTYIKEFVHGDFGRTRPNLCSLLGCQVDILALDVLDVELDWPPPVPGSE